MHVQLQHSCSTVQLHAFMAAHGLLLLDVTVYMHPANDIVNVCVHARMLKESGTKKRWKCVDASQGCTVQPVLKQLEALQRAYLTECMAKDA
jgi:hypothetical protein